MSTAPTCPECAAGKHVNCVGMALDPDSDELVNCFCPACAAQGHDPETGHHDGLGQP